MTGTPGPLPSLLFLLLFIAPAAAHDESEAPALDPQVARVWHEPAVPAPGEQWRGWIRFVPGHNVTEVLYQVCDVGRACIAPPTAATRLNETTWTYHTADYTDPVTGTPVPWGDASQTGGRDWRVGTQFFLTRADGNQSRLPHGLDLTSEECRGRYVECSETHYLAWDMPAGRVGGAREGAPGPDVAVLVAALAAVAVTRRARTGRS